MLSIDETIYCRRQIYEEVCSTGRMTLTRENSNTWKKAFPTATLYTQSTTELAWVWARVCIRGNRSTTNRLCHVQSTESAKDADQTCRKKLVSESRVLILTIPLTYFVYPNVIFYFLLYIFVLILINGLLLSLCDRLILASTPLLVLFSVPFSVYKKGRLCAPQAV